MRLLHCGVVLATNQGRICNPLQQSKTCESIAPSGLQKQLWFVASCLCRVWCASRIGKELSFFKNVVSAWWALNQRFLQRNELYIAHFENGKARLFAEHHLLFSNVLCKTFCSSQFWLVRFLDYSLRCSRMHLWWLPVPWDEYQRPLLKRFACCSLDAISTSVAFFRVIPRSSSAFLGRMLVPDAIHAFLERRLLRLLLRLLLCEPITL